MGRGILAADESVNTIGKRLIKAGLENTAEVRETYRHILFAHKDLGEYLSGVILHEETLDQLALDGREFVQVLNSHARETLKSACEPAEELWFSNGSGKASIPSYARFIALPCTCTRAMYTCLGSCACG